MAGTMMGPGMEGMSSSNGGTTMNNTMYMHHKMMMHMTFFWGNNAEILFSGWPGTRTGMYVLALLLVFVLSVLVEWISNSRFIKPRNNPVVAGLLQTLLHAIRMGLAYMVMLAVMSFNAGVFLVVVAGHAVGFLFFGSSVFKQSEIPSYEKPSDLPPMRC
ncbi:PREDICTED: copper transporter 6-like [Nelumbo nucifera]|uniref:Copper transport protein n=2 Tax=Nelumbo nucifera TaxID=4432 RepID=A0A822Y1T8_NELNU|nr:PREDICTED: copper transporter 6-like [Nelumbo nucifera]DAD26580.1 TPA_asm: hypothetical protein HUJ06_028048 [Nelumbo nucifera]